MSAKDNVSIYLKHILEAIAYIEEYIHAVSHTTFIDNHLTQDGVIRQLEIIGEAVRHVDVSVQQKYPDIPWKDMAGMRNKLIHDYFGVDIEAVWDTACKDIPVLKDEIQKIMVSEGT